MAGPTMTWVTLARESRNASASTPVFQSQSVQPPLQKFRPIFTSPFDLGLITNALSMLSSRRFGPTKIQEPFDGPPFILALEPISPRLPPRPPLPSMVARKARKAKIQIRAQDADRRKEVAGRGRKIGKGGNGGDNDGNEKGDGEKKEDGIGDNGEKKDRANAKGAEGDGDGDETGKKEVKERAHWKTRRDALVAS
ncbi:uncharacterized protein PAC_06074 [Phialocephala subalpina]|uniref:Uncharacterized protein n=1 Tax=Phialocephala subalpina TaxID=576137 RepID=A0A1L7WTU2_9HELO|nr:uncharacterized protein PAC_06074 [Phialocephala subalpina]